jgi:hypothetical protein
MEKVTVSVEFENVQYRGTLSPKESNVLLEKNDKGEWKELGSGLWSGKHIVYCKAKLDSYVYLLLEEKFLELKIAPAILGRCPGLGGVEDK